MWFSALIKRKHFQTPPKLAQNPETSQIPKEGEKTVFKRYKKWIFQKTSFLQRQAHLESLCKTRATRISRKKVIICPSRKVVLNFQLGRGLFSAKNHLTTSRFTWKMLYYHFFCQQRQTRLEFNKILLLRIDLLLGFLENKVVSFCLRVRCAVQGFSLLDWVLAVAWVANLHIIACFFCSELGSTPVTQQVSLFFTLAAFLSVLRTTRPSREVIAVTKGAGRWFFSFQWAQKFFAASYEKSNKTAWKAIGKASLRAVTPKSARR